MDEYYKNLLLLIDEFSAKIEKLREETGIEESFSYSLSGTLDVYHNIIATNDRVFLNKLTIMLRDSKKKWKINQEVHYNEKTKNW